MILEEVMRFGLDKVFSSKANTIDSYLPVYDMIRVAVVNTLENLFHEYSSVLLGEFSSRNDLIEELTTLADSKTIRNNAKITQSQCSIFSHPRRTRTNSFIRFPSLSRLSIILNSFKAADSFKQDTSEAGWQCQLNK